MDIRNAFVLGAGLGTRLRNLTAKKPKPLIPICQKPLITFAFDQLMEIGVNNLVVNTHHCPEAYVHEFSNQQYRGIQIHLRHEPILLETGGGIKNVQDLLGGEPFIVYNGDILTDLPIEKAVQHHLDAQNEVTLVLRSKDGPLQISMDETSGMVIDIAQRLGSRSHKKYLFTGIYIVNPRFFERIQPDTKISVIPIFLKMIEQGAKLGGIVLDTGHWWDLGTREQYLALHREFANYSIRSSDEKPLHWIHPSAQIASSAKINGATVIGANAKVGNHAALTDCIIWEEAEITSESRLERCIVTTHKCVQGVHSNIDF